MFKRILAVLLCLMMLAMVACQQKPDTLFSVAEDAAEAEAESSSVVNPLTGLSDIDVKDVDNRPVAIMINNIKKAQAVQTAVNKADIIYETEVEGGLTRLMAVYKNLSEVGQIGSVRSARYPYVDLALGHDAVYVHCGQDPTYCAPHLKDIDDLSIDTRSKGAKRIPNGLSSEHTLYAFGDELWESVTESFTDTTSTKKWQKFADEDKKVTLDGGSANSITVKFPASTTEFTYDSASGLYTRCSGGKAMLDYKTSEKTQVKNVFVLLTSITDYPDGVHRKVALEGGDGYYMTNGTKAFIKWTKGASTNAIKFTDTDGNPIEISAGKSWICIVDKHTTQPTIE